MRAQRSGVIANIGSMGSWRGSAGSGLYRSTKFALTGLTESLRLEVAHFGIEVCCIEPGSFRTGILNPSARVVAKTRLEQYDDTPVGKTRAVFEQTGLENDQPGDTAKACKVIAEVLTGECASPIPERLVLGSDAYRLIKTKCEETLVLLDNWKEHACSTNLSEGS